MKRNQGQLSTLISNNKEARKYLASKDIKFFAKYYLRRYITTDILPGTLHYDWAEKLMTDESGVLACPRTHGKSTWFSLIYPLWCILFKKHDFILLISDTYTQSNSLLSAVVSELEANEQILQDFGDITGFAPEKAKDKQRWTTKDIITLTGVRVMALGANAKFRGIRHREKRPSLIIIDDFENDTNVQSSEQRAKLKALFTRSIMNLGSTVTRFIMVGTILHFDSLLQNLLDQPPPGWFSKLYRAINEAGKAIWPQYWSLETLEKKKAEIGTIAFEQEFMNNPLDEGARIIYRSHFYDSVDPGFLDCFAYVDLASKEKETSDYTAITTVGVHRETKKIYVVAADRIRGSIYQQIDLIYKHFDIYRHMAIEFEEVAYQTVLQQVIQRETQKGGKYEGRYIPIIPGPKTIDKVQNAKGIAAFCENGTVLFQPYMHEFNAEIDQFPKASHDDYVDTLVGAVKLALSYQGASSTIQSSPRTNYPKNY
jgi:predicted phage terminase large subunit-like protein